MTITDADHAPNRYGTAARIRFVADGDERWVRLLERLVDTAAAGLPLMIRPDSGEFAFTRKRGAREELALHGQSRRYAAITVLGARHLAEAAQRHVFRGALATEYLARLIGTYPAATDLGEAALVTWAAAELRHPRHNECVQVLLDRVHHDGTNLTVQTAWALSALVAAQRGSQPGAECKVVHDRLLGAFRPASGVFAHWNEARHSWRAHVACFADQVYPIQALARYHRTFGDPVSLEIASRCANTICRLQGEAGQWWWHYDCRTGRIIERYPVYTVHQDAMAPMALLDLQEAGGPDFREHIRRGLTWMEHAPEVAQCLIQQDLNLIWRSARRTDPLKAVRSIRAAATRATPSLRLSWLDRLFPPRSIDYEDRPYHLGWILYTWLA